MEKARKHMFIFRMVCVILAIVTALPLCIAGCNKNKHVCESKCPTCGYCLNKECKDPVCEMKCKGHKDDGPSTPVTIKNVQVVVKPKTEYYPGEVFDPSGLVMKATLSSNKSKNLFDKDLASWTHKDEKLTEEVTKITLTLSGYDYSFDLPITVGFPKDMTVTADTSTLKEKYTTDETIDFTTVSVRVTTGGTTTVLKESEWKLFKGETEITDKSAVKAKDLGIGDITLTAQYLPGQEKNFTVTIVDATKVISPAFIEAEDCVYNLDDDGNETDTLYTYVEATSRAQYYSDTTLAFTTISSGASGRGAVARLTGQYSGKKVFFKFNVNVPEDGSYKIRARAQAVGKQNVKNRIAVNINGAKGADGKFEFTLNNENQYIYAGNRMGEYCDLAGKSYTNYYNMFWWGVLDIGSFELKKGENTIRVYMPSGIEGNIDYFEVVASEEAQTAKIMSMRTGARVDLSKNVLYLEKGKKLTDIVVTNELHPLTYTLLYIRLSTGVEVPVLGKWVEDKIDYTKVGVEQIITVTDDVSGETASFTLIIEDIKAE